MAVAGATAATLSLGSATWASAGAYSVLVSTPLGRLLSRPANVVVSGAARVLAWGYNGNGQTNVPAGLGEVAAVAAGGNHTVVLRANGTVAGWGYAALGQTTAPAGLGTAVALSAGKYHNAALRADGTVVAWGYNVFGQTNVPAGLSNCVAVAAGWYHTVALRENGTVVAWGHNGARQTNAPAGLSNVLAVAAGDYHTVALRDNGTVVAWGDNRYGQSTVPADLSGVVAVAAGWNHTLALKSDGSLVVWGAGTTTGSAPHYGQAIAPAGLANVVGLAGGAYHTVVRRTDGSLVAWGAGTTVGSIPEFGQAQVLAGLTQVIQCGAGAYHTVVLSGPASGLGAMAFAPAPGGNIAGTGNLKISALAPTDAIRPPASSPPLAERATGRASDTPAATLRVTGQGTLMTAVAEPGSSTPAIGRGEFTINVQQAAGAAAPVGGLAFTWTFGAGRYEIVSTEITRVLSAANVARLEGRCAINGVGGFACSVLVVPNRGPDGAETQRLRLQIRDAATGTVVFDTQPSTGLEANLDAAGQLIAGRVTIDLTGPARE